MAEFCRCDDCGKSINVGDELVSLTLSVEKADSEYSVQPLRAQAVKTWCIDCAPYTAKKASSEMDKVEVLNKALAAIPSNQ